ncbi:MAG: adenine phosphoribosyltransferase [Calditrichia bacterium]|nr:adenine phosphoribosyltransferase [Calditrichota bacterium]MCB0285142.1 adenine phosphoribosyltransferase [Calditrichota bacterium]MCB9068784.1 adenine phosphoribosyltransferase [Calditrichia bacterium]
MTTFEKHIRNVPDFPIKGIQFKDITTLLKEPDVFAQSVDELYAPFRNEEINKIVGIESRGFIFGAALAYKLNIGFVPVRKPGKLPAETLVEEYELEYGQDSLEIHADALDKGNNVLVVDDLLATGGTAAATCRLVERLGGNIVGVAFLIELVELNGINKLNSYTVHSLMKM